MVFIILFLYIITPIAANKITIIATSIEAAIINPSSKFVSAFAKIFKSININFLQLVI